MSESPTQQKTSYPLPVYQFRVTVAGVTMSFSEVSGLELEQEFIHYRHGHSSWEGEAVIAVPSEKWITVTLKRGVFHGVTALPDWLRSAELRPVDISLCDGEGAVLVTWRLGRAMPVKLQGPSFSASGNEVAIETLELMATRIALKHH